MKLHALTAMREFDALDTFARSRWSPIGYEASVRHPVEAGHLKQAPSYVIRCDSPKRVELYVLCADWRAAGRECKERGDKKGMEYRGSCVPHIDYCRQLRKSCPNSLIARGLDQLETSMK
jgi:hypothetical protein